MKIKIEIACDNAAFEMSEELHGVIMRLLEKWGTARPYDCKLRDSNGNTVGQATVTE